MILQKVLTDKGFAISCVDKLDFDVYFAIRLLYDKYCFRVYDESSSHYKMKYDPTSV
jgi:hypothetical protein